MYHQHEQNYHKPAEKYANSHDYNVTDLLKTKQTTEDNKSENDDTVEKTFQYYKQCNHLCKMYEENKHYYSVENNWRENCNVNNICSSRNYFSKQNVNFFNDFHNTNYNKQGTYYDNLLTNDKEYKTFVIDYLTRQKHKPFSTNSLLYSASILSNSEIPQSEVTITKDVEDQKQQRQQQQQQQKEDQEEQQQQQQQQQKEDQEEEQQQQQQQQQQQEQEQQQQQQQNKEDQEEEQQQQQQNKEDQEQQQQQQQNKEDQEEEEQQQQQQQQQQKEDQEDYHKNHQVQQQQKKEDQEEEEEQQQQQQQKKEDQEEEHHSFYESFEIDKDERNEESQSKEEMSELLQSKYINPIGKKVKIINSFEDEGIIVKTKFYKSTKNYLIVVNNKLITFNEEEFEYVNHAPPLTYEATKKLFLFFLYPTYFQHNIQLDEVSFYSVTDCQTADLISKCILNEFSLRFKSTIVDANACIGGNTISFYKYFRRIIAIENDTERFMMLENNVKQMEIYLKNTKKSKEEALSKCTKFNKKVIRTSPFHTKIFKHGRSNYYEGNQNKKIKNNVNNNQRFSVRPSSYHSIYPSSTKLFPLTNSTQFTNSTQLYNNNKANTRHQHVTHIENEIIVINQSCLQYISSLSCQIDVIFFDPPWGGENYKQFTELDLYLDNITIGDICNQFYKVCRSGIVIKAPLNFCLKRFILKVVNYFEVKVCRKFHNIILLILKKRKEKENKIIDNSK